MLKDQFKKIKNIEGQSLIEIMIGVAIGAILIGGAAAVVSLTLRSGVQNKSLQIATSLSQELLDRTESFADANWHNVYALSKSPVKYHLAVSGGAFIAGAPDATEVIAVEGVSYSRSFTIENVSRDAGENIEAVYNSANDDPSTQKIVVKTTWSQGPDIANVTLHRFITRKKNLVFQQTDWSAGSGQPGLWVNTAKYDTSAGILISSPTGSIKKAP